VHARSATALDAGEFELRVVAAPPAATSMAGRSAHLLTAAEQHQLAAAFLATGTSDAVTVRRSASACPSSPQP